ncbi:hypothetical protein C8Q79DRAFT_912135 [Trametes meyenii]|nr:hypothetical protein C8Q79DRAFT_912135 [Trametes meyenii]
MSAIPTGTNASTTAAPGPHDVQTTLNYYAPLSTDEPPYQYTSLDAPPPGRPMTNVGSEVHPVVVHDVRGREAEFTLDANGFQYVRAPATEREFTDDERIREAYYPEVEALLKKATGGKRVFIFDHTVRRSPIKEDGKPGRVERGPVEAVHVDQTYEASRRRVEYHLPEDASRLLASRVRLINVWRPIANPVAHKPLAVSDWQYLDNAHDLVPVRLIYPGREGATFSVRYNPAHRWHYLSAQTPEEVLFIKCYDSEEDRARLTAHTAFEDKTSPKDAPQRQSIEVRALVFDAE